MSNYTASHTATIPTEPLPEIPGVDHLSRPERGARPVVGPFYPDQLDLLAHAARRVRDCARPGRIFIAPEGIGFTIFQRGARV